MTLKFCSFFVLFGCLVSPAEAKLYNAKCNGCVPQDGQDPQVHQILVNYAGTMRNGDVVQIQDSNVESNPPNSYLFANWTYNNGQFHVSAKGYNYIASGGGPSQGGFAGLTSP